MPTTVTSTIGPTGDYTSLSAWEAACPANLVTDDKIWRGEVENTTLTSGNGTLTVSGQTVDATRYVELTTEAGASFMDHADKLTNPLRYNASVGAAINEYVGYGGSPINISTQYTRVSNLQMRNGVSTMTHSGPNAVIKNLIIETVSGTTLGGGNSTVSNVLVIRTTSGGIITAYYSGTVVYNCTFVVPSNVGAADLAVYAAYTTSVTFKNCAAFNVTNFAGVSFSGNNNGSSATIGFGTSNQASLTYADQFEVTSNASGAEDFRLKSGADLIDTGADLSGSGVTTDIVGTARGATYDIGAWEVAGAAAIVGTLAVTLAAATLSATGALPIVGTSAVTLAAATLSATGTLPIVGTSAVTLAAATLSATATLAIAGTVSATLGNATLSASGTLPIVGTAGITLGVATLSATGALPIVGAAAVTLDNATLAATGALPVVGTAAITLDNATLSATGSLPIVGQAAATLADASLSATGTLAISGTLTATLADATLVAFESASVVVPSASRTLRLPARARSSTLAARSRGIVLPARDRAVTLPPERS